MIGVTGFQPLHPHHNHAGKVTFMGTTCSRVYRLSTTSCLWRHNKAQLSAATAAETTSPFSQERLGQWFIGHFQPLASTQQEKTATLYPARRVLLLQLCQLQSFTAPQLLSFMAFRLRLIRGSEWSVKGSERRQREVRETGGGGGRGDRERGGYTAPAREGSDGW